MHVPGSLNNGRGHAGHKHGRIADSGAEQSLESCIADSNDCSVSGPAGRPCLCAVAFPVVRLPGQRYMNDNAHAY